MLGDVNWGQLSVTTLFRDRTVSVLLSIFVTATVAGVSGAWLALGASTTLLGLHVSIWVFSISWAVLVGYCSYLRTASLIIGTGLFVVGLVVLIKPPAEIGRRLVGRLLSDPEGTLLAIRVAGGLTIAAGMSLRGRGRARLVHEAHKRFS